MFLKISLCILVTFNFSLNLAQEWSYEEQQNWPSLYRNCAGDRQSPININTDKISRNPSLSLKFSGYDIPLKHLTLNNNGHTARLTLDQRSKKPSISGSAVGGGVIPFIFEELHFHWGIYNDIGSEHSIGYKFGSAELHFVHYNQKYGSFAKAREQSDGITVLTVILDISKHENEALKPIIKALPHIHAYNSSAIIRHTFIIKDLLPKNKDVFFRYKGSLTTPPCTENVVFIIFEDPIGISTSQLSQFRRLYERPRRYRIARVASDRRVIQPKNGRIVEISVPNRRKDFRNDILFTFDENDI